jgi:hypothetical protein
MNITDLAAAHPGYQIRAVRDGGSPSGLERPALERRRVRNGGTGQGAATAASPEYESMHHYSQ